MLIQTPQRSRFRLFKLNELVMSLRRPSFYLVMTSHEYQDLPEPESTK